MKNNYHILIVSILLTACAGSDEQDATSNEVNIIETDPDSIIGQWQFVRDDDIYCYYKEDENFAQEWTYMYMPDRTNIVFTEDSCFRVDFPLELKEGSSYQIDPINLNVEGSLDRCRYIVQNDTLLLYRFDDWMIIKQIFKRIPDEDSLVGVLKRDTINFPHLADTWYIMREWSTGLDDGSYYTLNFDYEIPDSITITREQILATCYGDKKIFMKTNGQLKPYHYGFRSYRDFWDRDVREFYLVPGDWYKGDSVEIHLERW